MGLFDIFNKGKKVTRTTDNGVAGPSFLDGLTEHITDPRDLQKHEWRRKLKATSGQTKFKIKYFGQLHPEYPNLIVALDDTPAMVVAVEPTSGQEILIFDGCKHGYNAMFCDNYSDEQKKKRKTDKIYQTLNGVDIFGLTISTYNGFNFEDEFSGDVDADGLIVLIDGSRIEFETAKRNGFDTLQILGTTDNGDVIEIVCEELA